MTASNDAAPAQAVFEPALRIPLLMPCVDLDPKKLYEAWRAEIGVLPQRGQPVRWNDLTEEAQTFWVNVANRAVDD